MNHPPNSEKENADPESDNKNRLYSRSSLSETENGSVRSDDPHPGRVGEPKLRVPEAEDFTLLKPISRGAFGKVFIGCKKKDPSKVYAIKVMKKADIFNKNLIAQVTTERDALAMIHSPFVVEIYYSLQSEQNIYLVMEYLSGGDVKSLLAAFGYLGEDIASMYIAEVTLALEHLHRKGIIHRDLKPDNMLIAANGHLKLTDFGLSKVNLDVNTTPVLSSQMTPVSRLEQYRTPGQVLSLRSSLVFSDPRSSGTPSRRSTQMSGTRNSRSRKSLLSPSTNAPCGAGGSATPLSPPADVSILDTPTLKHRSLLQRLGAPSVYSNETPKSSRYITATPSPSAIAKSLTPTLQGSLRWKIHSSSLDAPVSPQAASDKRRPLRYSSSIFTSINDDVSRGHRRHHQLLADSSISSNDDVFSSTHHDLKDLSDIGGHTPDGRGGDGEQLDCLSHDRASSRQESLEDHTPLLHRTDESIYNSFSARNLRSFREGSPLEEDWEERGEVKDTSSERNLSPPFQYPTTKLTSVPEEGESLPSSQESVSEMQPSSQGSMTEMQPYSQLSVNEKQSELQGGISKLQPDSHNKEISESSRGKSVVSGETRLSHPNRKRSYDNLIGNTAAAGLSGLSHTGLTQEVCVMRLGDIKQRQPGHSGGFNSMSRSNTEPLEASMECEESGLLNQGGFAPHKIRITSKDSTSSADSSSSDRSPPKKLSAMRFCAPARGSPATPHQGFSFSGLYQQSSASSPENEAEDFNISMGSDGEKGSSTTSFQLRQPQLELDVETGAQGDAGAVGKEGTGKLDPGRKAGEESKAGLEADSEQEVAGRRETESVTAKDKQEAWIRERLPWRTPMVKPTHKPAKNVGFKEEVEKRSPHTVCCMSVTKIQVSHADPTGVSDTVEHSIHSTPERQNDKTKVSVHCDFITPQRRPLSVSLPLRTPREGVRRGPEPKPQKEERILGTPDYLAPEILLQEKHGLAVDWWALGVCLFEFLTGLPPFNDETPELVFNNILNRAIAWPTPIAVLSAEAQNAINALLTMDQSKRAAAAKVKSMALFSKLDWDHLLDKEPPFVPQPEDILDTSYFDPKNNLHQLTISAVDL